MAEKKPVQQPDIAARLRQDEDAAPASSAQAPFTTAAEQTGMAKPEGVPDPRLSQSPGLVILKDSEVPGLGNGGMVSHVEGPGQAPVDPVAAGLDTGYDPGTRQGQRAVTQTGTLAAGPRPSTYAEKPDGAAVQQAAPADMRTLASPQPSDSKEGEKPKKIPGGDPSQGT